MNGPTRTITVPATLENLERLTSMVSDHLRDHGVPEKESFEVDLAVDEACTNVIRYAYGPDGGMVTVTCSVAPCEVRVCICDQGHPFDPLAVQAPDLTGGIDDRPVGGLGVHLIRSLMDHVTWEYRDGKNILCMTRHLREPVDDDESDSL